MGTFQPKDDPPVAEKHKNMGTLKQKNYLGYFRGIGILIFLVFSFFAYASTAKADVPPDVCSNEQISEGNHGAIFALTDFRDLRQGGFDPPVDQVREWVCISVPTGAEYVTFDDFAARSQFLSGAARNYGVNYLYFDNRPQIQAQAYVTSRDMGGVEGRYLQGTAGGVRYYLIDGKEMAGGFFDRYFYLIKFGGENKYLYFMGFLGEGRMVPNSIIWGLNDVEGIKGLVRVDHGETKTVVIKVRSANPGADGEVNVVTCTKCEEVGMPRSFAVAGGQILPAFDTKRIVERLRPELPTDIVFIFRGTTGQGEIKKYSEFRLTLHINPFDCSQFNRNQGDCARNSKCFWFAPDNQCVSRTDPTICPKLSQILCGRQSDGRAVGSEICTWATSSDGTINQCVSPTVSSTIDTFTKPPGYQGPIPDCAWSGSCRNVNALLQVLLNYGQQIFSMIGMLAFVMFVIGGFMMIFSMGSPDRVKKGRDILIAAVVGMIIVFSAYILVNFLLDALGVGEGFRAIQ